MGKRATILTAAVLLARGSGTRAAEGPAPEAAPTAASFLLPAERDAVLDALARIGLDQRDLGFNKDYVNAEGRAPDRWRFPLAAELLARPLEAPALAREIEADLVRGLPQASRFAGAAATHLGFPFAIDEADVAPPALEPALMLAMAGRPEAERAAARTAAARLEPAVAAALARVLRAALEADAELGRALPELGSGGGSVAAVFLETLRFADPTETDEEEEKAQAEKLLAASDGVRYPELYRAAARLFRAVERAEEELAAAPPQRAAEGLLLDLATELGRVVVAGPGGDVHDLAAAIILDLGGSDVYRLRSPRPTPGSGMGGVRVIVDLAGDDLYDANGETAALAGTLGGISLLSDRKGDDFYRGGKLSLGGAAFGVAALVDLGGDDVYVADAHSQGAGSFGVGLLEDRGGADQYRAAVYAQGFAGVRGLGLLHDLAGWDSYYAGGRYMDNPGRFARNSLSLSQGFSIGIRPHAGGGIGVLADEAGNDQYYTEVYGQGASYWFALGLLHDRQGDDVYSSLQYAQGSGIHLSSALLVDDAGNDTYACGHLGQGSSHDLSVGWLIDHQGNDTYAGMSTLQGGALTNSATFLVDGGGDDTYAAHELLTSRGTANVARGWGGVGVFLDLGGHDVYNPIGLDAAGKPQEHGMEDGAERVAGNVGVSLDRAGEAEAAAGAEAAAPEPAAAPVALAPRGDYLARLKGSVSWSNPRARFEAEKAALVAEGPEVLRHLLPLLGRELLLEQYAVQDVVYGITRPPAGKDGEPAPGLEARRAAVAAILLDHIGERGGASSYEGLRWVVRWLGELKVEPERTAAALGGLALDPSFRVRAACAESLGLLGASAGREALERLLADREDSVRAVAARALGQIGDPRAIPALAAALADRLFGPRRNAAEALAAIAVKSPGAKQQVRAAVEKLAGHGDSRVRWIAADLLRRLDAAAPAAAR